MQTHITFGVIDISKKRGFWKEFANEIDGEFTIIRTKSRDFETLKINILYKDFEIIFEETDLQSLKIKSILNINKDIRFNIHKKDYFDNLTKIFKRNIFPFDNNFGKNYLIQSSDIKLIHDLLSTNNINIFLKSNIYFLASRYNSKEKSIHLECVVNRTISTKEELYEIHQLYLHVIDVLLNY